MEPQHGLGDARTKELLLKKVDTLLNQGYLNSDLCILVLMNYFSIPKGLDDIRAVFDGTKSGLNGSLWVPWFGLPTVVDGMMRTINPYDWGANSDYGKMFYNFWLHQELHQYCGIDLSPLLTHHTCQTSCRLSTAGHGTLPISTVPVCAILLLVEV